MTKPDAATVARAMRGDAGAQEECTEVGYALPCPFCGGRASLRHSYISDCYSVLCAGDTDACAVRLQMKECVHSALGYAHPRSALAAWNTRATLPEGTEEV